MSTLAAPSRLTSLSLELDTSPAAFGELESSMEWIDDIETLRARMREHGYLYLPGYLDRAEVLAARRVVAERLASDGWLDASQPLMDCIANPNAEFSFRPDLAKENPALMRVLYSGAMMEFYERFLGGAVRHFDYTWFRAVAPGRGTPPHMDIVYMGRGTHKLFTAWTPLGDIPLEVGGLMILEKSHLHDRLNRNYGRKDVDKYCTNKRGEEYSGMGGGGNIAANGSLSRHPVKLRANLGGRWLTANYRAGDLLTFTMNTVHASLDNQSKQIRLSSDSRYQLASEPADERWIGENPIAHGPQAKRGMIC